MFIYTTRLCALKPRPLIYSIRLLCSSSHLKTVALYTQLLGTNCIHTRVSSMLDASSMLDGNISTSYTYLRSWLTGQSSWCLWLVLHWRGAMAHRWRRVYTKLHPNLTYYAINYKWFTFVYQANTTLCSDCTPHTYQIPISVAGLKLVMHATTYHTILL